MLNVADDEIEGVPLTEQLKTTPPPPPPAVVTQVLEVVKDEEDLEETGIRARGPDKNLEKEALRITGKLPTMTPGKQRGRAVRVPFSYPINFRLQQ